MDEKISFKNCLGYNTCRKKNVKESNMEKSSASKDNAKKQLTPEQYHITQECGTERPFHNAYWNNKEAGIYVDVISGEPLFASTDKYDSGTGWPSFVRPIEKTALVEKTDITHGMSRIEVKSQSSDSHLGHVFPDGPKETGLRYCINSAALRFIPLKDLEKEGLDEYRQLFKENQKLQKACFAAGCFWGIQAYFKLLSGVISTTVGYTGSHKSSPTYDEVCSGLTGYAEAVLVKFDARKITYETLLRHFWKMHNPTSRNRQGNDTGTQYRSALWYFSKEQKDAAMKSKIEIQKILKQPIVTEILPAIDFYPAEKYHQDYLDKNPGGYCHIDLNLARKP